MGGRCSGDVGWEFRTIEGRGDGYFQLRWLARSTGGGHVRTRVGQRAAALAFTNNFTVLSSGTLTLSI